MNVFELFAVLTLQKDDYEKNLNETEQKTKGWGGKIKEIMQSEAAAGIMIAVQAVIKLTKALIDLTVQTLNYADTVGDLAAKYGVTADAISEMQYIADQSSTSVEGLTNAMSMLYNKAKENGDAFKEVGISVKDTNGNFKAMDELFWETVGVLNDMESEGQKSAYMLEFFGRSAMNVGEVLRKSTDEIATMRQEAHDLGIVLNENTINFASDTNDMLAVFKLRFNSIMAELLNGSPEAERNLQIFFEDVMAMVDNYLPTLARFGIKLLIQASLAIIRFLPRLVLDIGGVLMQELLHLNWFQLGFDIGKAVIESALNIILATLNRTLGVFGVKIPYVNLGVGEQVFDTDSLGAEYEISENVRQDITVKVEASGDTAVSEDTAEKTAEKLAPYIDKILGGR